MPLQVMLGFMLTAVVPGLKQLFTGVIVPAATVLLQFTMKRLPRIPIYLRLLWSIYTDSEPGSEARKYLTSVLLVLSSVLSFMTYCYIPLTGAFLVGALITPVAAMIALVVSLVALDSILALNHDYLCQKYPEEFDTVSDDIQALKSALGGKKWEETVTQTQALLDDIKEKLDPNGIYDDTLLAAIKALDEYLWHPENDTSLSQEEINQRIVTEGLPPFAKVGGSLLEGAGAGAVVGIGGHGLLASIFTQAGFWTGIQAFLGTASGIAVGPAAYTAIVVAAPISMAVVTGAGVCWGANALRNDGEKRKLSKFLAEVLIAALPMAWVDGSLSQEEEDTIEQLMQHAAITEQDMTRVRQAIQSHQSFDRVLQDGLLKEKEPRKQQMKQRLILLTAYELAKADGAISPEELALHNRMAKIMGMQESEIQEMRRLLLLKSGINLHDRITIVQGDITQESVNAIVNSTNPNLRPGKKLGLINLPGNRNQVDTLIHKMAGPDLKTACQSINSCEVGEAKLTEAGNLPADWVIHTVTPLWQDNEEQAKSLLNQCYRNALSVAFEHSVETIAFPALGTGTGQIPVDPAAAIAIASARAFLDMHFTIRQVRFVCNDEQVYQQFKQALENEIGVLPEGDAFDASTFNHQAHHHYETYQPAA